MTPRCACAKPKPALIEDDTFEGLFSDIPVESMDEVMCDRCGDTITEPYPVTRMTEGGA